MYNIYIVHLLYIFVYCFQILSNHLWYMYIMLPVQSVSNHADGELYSIQHNVIKRVSDIQ